MPHVVLLGDSIFDNSGYVAGGPDVVTHLRSFLPKDWKATLGAVCGSVTGDVARQVGWLGSGVTHLVLSIGGNDALDHGALLGETAESFAGVLDQLADVRDAFSSNYNAMLDRVCKPGLPVAVCTIYDGRFPDPLQRKISNAALTIFNDVITRAVFSRGLTLIDLRLICDEDTDLANPIEPSVQGGAKIAGAVAMFCTDQHLDVGSSRVIAGSNAPLSGKSA